MSPNFCAIRTCHWIKMAMESKYLWIKMRDFSQAHSLEIIWRSGAITTCEKHVQHAFVLFGTDNWIYAHPRIVCKLTRLWLKTFPRRGDEVSGSSSLLEGAIEHRAASQGFKCSLQGVLTFLRFLRLLFWSWITISVLVNLAPIGEQLLCIFATFAVCRVFAWLSDSAQVSFQRRAHTNPLRLIFTHITYSHRAK